jgi:hypothetical protein
MKHDKITPDLAVLRARAQKANKTRSPVRITVSDNFSPRGAEGRGLRQEAGA